MDSIRFRTLPKLLLALFLTVATVGQSLAQEVGSAPAVSKEGVTPGATAGADGAPAAAEGAAPAAGGGDAAAIQAGDALFKGNCAQCHAVNEKVVGPALAGITKRRPMSWIIPWIKNSSKVVASGDAYAVKLFNEYGKQQMPSFALSDDEIKSIIAYTVSQEGSANPTPAPGATAGTDGAAPTNAQGSTEAGQYIDLLMIVLVVVLIVLVVTLVIIANLMKDVLRGRKDLSGRDVEQLNQRYDFSKIYKSGAVRGIAVTVFILVVLYESVQAAMGIGLTQGYQPTQPIAFSHKLHAGENQINCAYCHTSVYKSKSANIPSPNICMNCHSQIKTESPEIKKIYRAIERKQPIQWVRIHNLPDLAYFNHSQHTQVGGLECQTCHGPIQNMDVVYQYSALTMGWCINCHRETPLNTKGNAYYDNLVKLHDTKNSAVPFTVSSNGGTECSKCHY
ncbi:cytochrome c3 family protein [Hymenobacter defluvii]|uniref:C-type cytochrome n=1 Tax=Hymenobacter defluvii TaxID=2054411 RepID=A0ABS3THA6_9BACT|nr:cytochrome c3 family protein [Hymenobacter defluvii]MBO3273037.1 c-type cytochrome [Hymenobacter defluvii]